MGSWRSKEYLALILERLGCIAYGEIPKINQRVGCGMHVKGKEDACSQLKCVHFVRVYSVFC